MVTDQIANVLIAEDDDDHYFLTEKIFRETLPSTNLQRVLDGEDLMNYLLHSGGYAAAKPGPRPSIIILDLNMPRMDGWEVLKEIKSNVHLRQIPVVVLTTSDVEEDKFRSYDLGANSYIRKPVEFKKWVETIHLINRYWFEAAELPHRGGEHL